MFIICSPHSCFILSFLYMKKIVLKVIINGKACKAGIMKAVTKLTGIDEVSVDAEKGTITVVGNIDPVLLTSRVRKTGKVVEIVSVGPPKPVLKPEPKPDDSGKEKPKPPDPEPFEYWNPLPYCCDNCQLACCSQFCTLWCTSMCHPLGCPMSRCSLVSICWL